MKKITWRLTALVAFTFASCTSDVAPNLCEEGSQKKHDISYSLDVAPVVARSCAVPGCHVGAFPNGNFTSYHDLKTKADNGALHLRLTGGQMPPADSGVRALSFCEVDLIVQWITEGAKNN